MNTNQIALICKELGIEIRLSDAWIREERGYYENYHQIEFDGQNWCYSMMNFERRPEPRKEDTRKFTSEREAIKYFFIKILSQFYFKKIFPANNPIYEINTIEGLEEYFRELGVSEENYSFSSLRAQEVYAEKALGKMSVSFIDRNRQEKFATLPLDMEDGIFEMYKLTYRLHLFKTLEKKFIQSGILTEEFSDDDIELFIK